MNMCIQFFHNVIPSLFMQHHSSKTHFSTLLRLQLLEILTVTLRLPIYFIYSHLVLTPLKHSLLKVVPMTDGTSNCKQNGREPWRLTVLRSGRFKHCEAVISTPTCHCSISLWILAHTRSAPVTAFRGLSNALQHGCPVCSSTNVIYVGETLRGLPLSF